MLYCTILYYTILYYTILYYTILNYTHYTIYSRRPFRRARRTWPSEDQCGTDGVNTVDKYRIPKAANKPLRTL